MTTPCTDAPAAEPGDIDLPPFLRVCNCAGCGKLLLGRYPLEEHSRLLAACEAPLPPMRIAGTVRPLCREACGLFESRSGRVVTRTYPEAKYEPSPWLENAVRALEDAG